MWSLDGMWLWEANRNLLNTISKAISDQVLLPHPCPCTIVEMKLLLKNTFIYSFSFFLQAVFHFPSPKWQISCLPIQILVSVICIAVSQRCQSLPSVRLYISIFHPFVFCSQQPCLMVSIVLRLHKQLLVVHARVICEYEDILIQKYWNAMKMLM